MALGERIRQLRVEHAWSQAELGERVGADSQRISRYENERITPSIDALVRLAQALDVTIDYLAIDGAPRQPFTATDPAIAERIGALEALDPEDRDAINRIIDGLLAKTRVQHALTNTG
jgi:transcriptional regulator with XRE-family HTH domain